MRKAGGTGEENPKETVTAHDEESPKETVTGMKQAGAACTSGSHYGTVMMSGGKYVCNFTPSTLPVGAACHYNSSMGTVTVVDGKRYCKI